MTAASGGFSPTKTASPLGHPPWPSMRCWTGRAETKATSCFNKSGVNARSGVMSSTILIPRVNCQVTDGNGRKMVALKFRPAFSAINRNPESEFGAEEKKIRFDQVFLNHVHVSANALRVLSSDERRPGLTEIRGLENVRRHVAKSMPIKSGVSRAGIEVAGLHPVDP